LRRLARMGPHELCTRGRQAAMKRTDVLLYRLGLDPCPRMEPDSGARGRFYSDPEEIPRIASLIYGRMPDRAAALIERAERILARRFDLLGCESLDFGSDIDWSLDPVHPNRAASAPWPSIPYLNFEAVGDHKIIWELNRHQILVTLARAYRITGDARFAAGVEMLWRDWQRKNPYPTGINWTSTLEVAFRALSWVWAGFLLEGSAADSAGFQRDLARGLARSAWYIERFLSTYFSPNTHLLGEGLALMTIGLRYPGLPRAGAWADTGWKIVVDAANRQVRADGGYFEQSTYYHVYALDMFLHARILAGRDGLPIPEGLDRTIRHMLSSLAAISRAGATPRFGDDDGGRLFDPSRNRAEHLRDPLSTGAVLFGDSAFKAAAPGLTEETLWLLGPDAAAAFDAIPEEPPGTGAVELPDCGIYGMASRRAADPPSRVCQFFIDCGPQGFGGAGHGHADALSVQLAANGRLWLTDPGTCEYVGGNGLRDRFRGTAAHNTLTVDGRDQAEPSGPFSWSALPRIEPRRWVPGETFTVFEGRHFGYERLPAPVVHRRWIVGCGDGFWLVRDVAEGQGTHRLEIRWRFAPGLDVTARGAAAAACEGGESLTLLGEENENWRLSVEDSDYSPSYGARVTTRVARWSHEGPCPAEFAAAICFEAKDEARLTRMGGEPAGAAGYEYAAGDVRRRFFFGAGNGAWRCGEWASDAAVLCFTTRGESRELALAGGSFVEYGGRRALDAGAPEALIELRYSPKDWRCSCALDPAMVREVLP
jgi:hypothetical protein